MTIINENTDLGDFQCVMPMNDMKSFRFVFENEFVEVTSGFDCCECGQEMTMEYILDMIEANKECENDYFDEDVGKSDTVRSLARENFVELIPIMEIMCEECWEKTEDLSVPR